MGWIGLSWSNEKRQAYKAWVNLRYRCRSVKKYQGVTFCDDWVKFDSFLSDMGLPQKGQSIDRIDNTKGYSADNCRWADMTTQNRNRSIVVLDEVTVLLARRLYSYGASGRKLAKFFDVNHATLQNAISGKTWSNL